MKRALGLSVSAFAVGVATISREAWALGPSAVEIAAQIGVGDSTLGSGNPNSLGLGLGARAGIDVLGFYGGVAAMYYVGSGNNGTDTTGTTVHTYARSWLVGAEGGYDLHLAFMTLRPQLGIGYYYAGITYTPYGPCVGTPSSTSGDGDSIYVEPGVTGLFSFGRWFAGADLGVLFVPAISDSQAAVVVHGQLGVQL